MVRTPLTQFARPIISLVLVYTLLLGSPAQAQSGIRLVESEASYLFNDHLRISAQFESESPLVEGQVFIRSEAQEDTTVMELDLDTSQAIEIELVIDDELRLPGQNDLHYRIWQRQHADQR